MGDKLTKYYEHIQKEAGIAAKMRLAMITSVPSTLAATQPDSPDLIAKFKAAIKEITGKEAPNF